MGMILVVLVIVLAGLAVVQCVDDLNILSSLVKNIIFVIYISGVLFFTIVSRQPSGDNRVNFILFFTVIRSLRWPVHIEQVLQNLLSGQFDQVFTTVKPLETAVLNILLFVPMGYMLPHYIRQKRSLFKRVLMISVICSLCIEVIQTITGLGWFDVDDLFCNMVGGAIGFLLHKVAEKIRCDRGRNCER